MTSGKKSRPPIDGARMLLALLDEAFDHKSWHGPNLRGSLKGVSAEQAAWRPSPRRHNIWEMTLHAAYWKYVVRRRLTGEKRGAFILKGSNFFERPRASGLTETAWKQDLAILMDEHQKLRRTVEEYLNGAAITQNTLMIRGIAAHDLYHAGQIRMLRRLQE